MADAFVKIECCDNCYFFESGVRHSDYRNADYAFELCVRYPQHMDIGTPRRCGEWKEDPSRICTAVGCWRPEGHDGRHSNDCNS
jgi:hypothetical protein